MSVRLSKNGFSFAITIAIAIAASGCGSCRGGNAPTPVGGTSVDIGIAGGAKATLRYGRATTSADGLDIILTADPTSCGQPVNEGSTYARVLVGAGPGGNFFAGRAIGVEVTFAIADKKTSAAPFHSTLTLEPFELQDGGKLKGTVAFEGRGKPRGYGHGGFEIEICKKTPLPDGAAQPASVSGPVKGSYGDHAFDSGTALIELSESNDGPPYLDSVYFFPEKGVTCGLRGDHLTNALRIHQFASAQGDVRWKQAQPASASFVFPEDGQPKDHAFGGRFHPAWIQFDALEHKRGTTAKGSMHVDALVVPGTETTPAKIEGTFEATVCPWANDDEETSGSSVVFAVGDLGGAEQTATHARVRPLAGGMELVVSTGESTCKAADQQEKLGDALVAQLAGTQPGAAKVEGARVLSQGKEARDATSGLSVTLDAVEWREFAHVRGHVSWKDGAASVVGAFDAIVCPDRFGSTASSK
jgi:hypothetical protein